MAWQVIETHSLAVPARPRSIMNTVAAHRLAHFVHPANAEARAYSASGLALEIIAIGLFVLVVQRLLVWALEDTHNGAEHTPTKSEQRRQAARQAPGMEPWRRAITRPRSVSSFSESTSKSSSSKSTAHTVRCEAVPERGRSRPASVTSYSSGSRFYANVVQSKKLATLAKPRRVTRVVSSL